MVEINKAWNAIRVILQDNFAFYEIKKIVGLAGFDITLVAHLEQTTGGGASKGQQLITAIDRGISQLGNRGHFISVVIEEILKRKSNLRIVLQQYLERLVLTIINEKVLPIKLLDASELVELPENAHHDLVNATIRFRDGGLSGAISSACAAIDTVTSRIYEENNLGDSTKASFQEKCNRSIESLDIIGKMKKELRELGWDQVDIFANNLKGSLNQAAYVMQSLRAKMGDVHGTKPTLKPLVYSSLKWASLILKFLNKN